jgi:thiamine pyrophosphokinase
MFRAVIFVNGSIPDIEKARNLVQPGDLLIAADGGSRHALDMGFFPSVVVGDMDSLLPEQAKRLEDANVKVIPHPRDKDDTDFELALNHALDQGCKNILVIGALGYRLDQTIGNISLLTNPKLNECSIHLDDGLEEVFFCLDECQVIGQKGETISLIPWGAKVNGIFTDGLKWPLRGETLFPFRTRGISNQMMENKAHIRISSGTLLIVHRRYLGSELKGGAHEAK